MEPGQQSGGVNGVVLYNKKVGPMRSNYVCTSVSRRVSHHLSHVKYAPFAALRTEAESGDLNRANKEG